MATGNFENSYQLSAISYQLSAKKSLKKLKADSCKLIATTSESGRGSP